MCLPLCELDCAGNEDNHTGCDRNSASQCRYFHLHYRQGDAQRKDGQSEQGPNEEVAETGQRGELDSGRLVCPPNGLAIAPQHWRQRWQHHRCHHHRPHARGTTQWPRSTFDRAFASMPSTSSSRLASAFLPSLTWSRTNALSPLCLRRTASAETAKKARWEPCSEASRARVRPCDAGLEIVREERCVGHVAVSVLVVPGSPVVCGSAGSQVVRIPGLQARPLGGGASIGPDNACSPLSRCGQPAGESSHVSCRP